MERSKLTLKRSPMVLLMALTVIAVGWGGCYKEPRVRPPSPSPGWPTPAPPSPTATFTPAPTPTVPGQVYVVQEGDTLWSIAKRFGVTMEAIIEANQLTDPDQLPVGKEIFIPLVPPS